MLLTQFLQVSRHRTLATVLFAILFISGCGEAPLDNPVRGSADSPRETEDFVPVSSVYYPMKVGSRWVYRNADGSEWSREVTDTKNVNAHTSHVPSDSYHIFRYISPIKDIQLDFLKAPTYVLTDTHLGLVVTDNAINDAIWQTILERSRGKS